MPRYGGARLQSSAAALKQIPKGHRVGLMSDLLNEEAARNTDKLKPPNGSVRRPSAAASPADPAAPEVPTVPAAPPVAPVVAPAVAPATTETVSTSPLRSVETSKEATATTRTGAATEEVPTTVHEANSAEASPQAEEASHQLKSSLEASSIKVLKEKCAEQQLSTLGCTEKSDLVELLIHASAINEQLGEAGSGNVYEPTPHINDID